MGPCDTQPTPQEGAQAGSRTLAFEARRGVKPEGFPRPWRLARGSDIRSTLRNGARFDTGHLSISWVNNQEGNPRLGLVVPRFGRTAVSRNLLRRRIRELARTQAMRKLGGLDVVIKAKPGAYSTDFDTLEAGVQRWLRFLNL